MHNFREITALVLAADAGEQVEDRAGLEDALRRLLNDEPRRLAMGERGIRLMAEQGGAASRHLEIIGRLLVTGSGE